MEKSNKIIDYKPLLDNICEAAYDTLPELTLIFPAEILLLPNSMLTSKYEMINHLLYLKTYYLIEMELQL
jgi:hypothetical protein